MAGKVNPYLEKIKLCIKNKKDFVVKGGAGSGKTYTLVETLKYVYSLNAKLNIACITYTNVAVEEIKERVPFENLLVSTIHEFIWSIIKNYKNNLVSALIYLTSNEAEKELKIRYNGENPLTKETYCPDEIHYKEYLKIDEGIFSHDEVLKLGLYLFREYPLISNILSDTFDYIFVDEFQDTDKLIIRLLLDEFRKNTKKSVLGFLGDPMQAIYNTGVGTLERYVETGQLKEIIIDGNRRCSISVISVLNNIRNDIEQYPEYRNKYIKGSVTFLYSSSEIPVEKVKNNKVFNKWDFKNIKETKELYLTNRLIARSQKFDKLHEAYREKYGSFDRLIKDPDKLATHLYKIQEIIYLYDTHNYNEFIRRTDYNILYHKDKVNLYENIQNLKKKINDNILDVVTLADNLGLCIIDNNLKLFHSANENFYNEIMQLSYSELINSYNYRSNFTLYSTQHGVKGAEFNNVFVVLDNGNWNNYNFEQLLDVPRNTTTYDRTHKLFYVCCSRAKRNLVVYCPNFRSNMLQKAWQWFGKENTVEI